MPYKFNSIKYSYEKSGITATKKDKETKEVKTLTSEQLKNGLIRTCKTCSDIQKLQPTFLHEHMHLAAEVYKKFIELNPRMLFIRDKDGNTPLHKALSDNLEVVADICAWGGPILLTLKDKEGKTPNDILQDLKKVDASKYEGIQGKFSSLQAIKKALFSENKNALILALEELDADVLKLEAKVSALARELDLAANSDVKDELEKESDAFIATRNALSEFMAELRYIESAYDNHNLNLKKDRYRYLITKLYEKPVVIEKITAFYFDHSSPLGLSVNNFKLVIDYILSFIFKKLDIDKQQYRDRFWMPQTDLDKRLCQLQAMLLPKAEDNTADVDLFGVN